jgi:ADP-heptose:LPS heptosyltransferase
VVGVGSRWQTKRWLPEHFAALVGQAQERFGGTAVFIGAPDEVGLSEQAGARLSRHLLGLAGRTTLPELVAILNEADVVLANDTGPLHVAVALGRPVVAPYTCTLVRCTGPYGQMKRAVQTDVWCQGSYLKRCDRLDCMTELTPGRLWPVLNDILLTWQQQRVSA